MLQHLAKGYSSPSSKVGNQIGLFIRFGHRYFFKRWRRKNCKKSSLDSLPHVDIGTFARTCNHIIAAFLSVIGFNIASVRSIPDICQFFGSTAQFRPVKRAPNVQKFETKQPILAKILCKKVHWLEKVAVVTKKVVIRKERQIFGFLHGPTGSPNGNGLPGSPNGTLVPSDEPN